MDSIEFRALLDKLPALREQGYNKLPLTTRIMADLDTPLSIFLKLANRPNSYLFESAEGGETWGRYSIIGLPASRRYAVYDDRIDIHKDGEVIKSITEVDDPLAWIEEEYQSWKVAPVDDLPGFTGGFVGYFGYDTIRYIEPRLANTANTDTLETPDIVLMISDEVAVFDNLRGSLSFVVLADISETACDAARERLRQLVRQTEQKSIDILPPKPFGGAIMDHNLADEEAFKRSVERAKEYIRAGDIMQVVLSHRMPIPLEEATALDVYRALRGLNPSPYMFYMDLGDFQIVGSSPEILVRAEGGMVTVRPIAGTRPRGGDEAEDRALEAELLADPKERAEHLMLIDLGRNDVGRVSETGSVRLTEEMVIERYSHVMHIVSNVVGKLQASCSLMDVLRATFPAGTVSGAPKIRAMEIIDELEPVKRGIYAGAVGYLSWSGNMDTAIALRTAVVKGDTLYIQAGAGIVADSDPAKEWQEVRNKGPVMLDAVATASRQRLRDRKGDT